MSVRSPHAVLFLTVAVGISGCAGNGPTEPAALPLTRLLPPPAELSGWIIAEGPVEYSPDTLYEYLNGGAERYQAHGFRRLLHVRYQLGDDPLACVTLDIYDMGSELGAFGIYSAARPVGQPTRRWGTEGYRTGTIAGACKGPIFTRGEADDDRPELLSLLENLMSRVTEGAPGTVAPPSILAPLPAAYRLAGSERYVPANLLGHSFLPGGVLAIYEIDGRRAELFFTDLGAETEAVDAMAALRAHFDQRMAVADGKPPLGEDGFRTSDPIFGQGSVVRDRTLIAGIHGDMPAREREDILGRLIAEITDPAVRR